jgi:glycerol-3-phosphate dehydrogenase
MVRAVKHTSSLKRYDVIIIGAGVTGAAIARELSRYDLRVLLLEKEAEPAFGVSKSNSGIIHTGIQSPFESLKGCLCVQGNQLIRRLAAELELDFVEVGELLVAFNEEEEGGLDELLRVGRRMGVPRLRIVNPAWLRDHEPNLSYKIRKALYAPGAGVISPYQFVYALTENAAANGVEIRTSTPVDRIAYEPTSGLFDVISGNSIFTGRFVVNAAGLYADAVAAMVGVDDFRITPRKGEEFILDKKREYLSNHLIFPLPNPITKGTLVIRTAAGNPMIGPTATDISDKQDTSTSEQGLQSVLESARALIPAIDPRDIIAYFSGLRPVAGDDFIIRHERRVPGMITVAGIQSPGLTAAPAVALMVKDILKECRLSLKKRRAFRARRKAIVRLADQDAAGREKLVRRDSDYGDIVCRCEMVSVAEIKEAIRRGARTLDGIKFRTRSQAGRCHGCFCTTRIMEIMAEELGIPVTEIVKHSPESRVVLGRTRET